jgi:hypothetical protein
MLNLKLCPKILVLLILFFCLSKQRNVVYHEKMADGTYIIAASHKLAKDEKALRHELGKHFHLPEHRSR